MLAVPVTVLAESDIVISPPLPPPNLPQHDRQAVPGCKVLLKFADRFWPEDCHGLICADSCARVWMDTVHGVGSDSAVTGATPMMLWAVARKCRGGCCGWRHRPSHVYPTLRRSPYDYAARVCARPPARSRSHLAARRSRRAGGTHGGNIWAPSELIGPTSLHARCILCPTARTRGRAQSWQLCKAARTLGEATNAQSMMTRTLVRSWAPRGRTAAT